MQFNVAESLGKQIQPRFNETIMCHNERRTKEFQPAYGIIVYQPNFAFIPFKGFLSRELYGNVQLNVSFFSLVRFC